ncbi:integrase/recombinase XerC [Lachnospiraceae bacterium PF1-22]
MNKSYQKEIEVKQVEKIREILTTLPPYVGTYIRSIETSCRPGTRLAYLRDLDVFFHFISETEQNVINKSQVPLVLLEKMTEENIDDYMSFLSHYSINGKEQQNSLVSKARKLSSLSSFMQHLEKRGQIARNPVKNVNRPSVPEKNIVALNQEEMDSLITCIRDKSQLSEREKKFHDRLEKRDIAIVATLLLTGIRVSELVGLNIDSVNFMYRMFEVVRKGGKEDQVYFGEQLEAILENYMSDRNNLLPWGKDDDTQALFLSLRGNRISVRSVELLVKNYVARCPFITQKITPHKLRSTYGTNLYRETGDIMLVADILGHKNVEVTRKHYAKSNIDKKRQAGDIVKLN